MSHKILVLHGPNLNLLGTREPEVYGYTTLMDVDKMLFDLAEKNQVGLCSFQSNAEFELINQIHQAKKEGIDFIIINPAALTHTSIALRDAFLGVGIPFVEVHLSNIHAREAFRHHSYLSDVAVGVICGLKEKSYLYALEYAFTHLNKNN